MLLCKQPPRKLDYVPYNVIRDVWSADHSETVSLNVIVVRF